MDLFEQLEQSVATAKKDAEQFFKKGNKSAGTRLRKQLQEIKGLCQDLRVKVTEEKNKA